VCSSDLHADSQMSASMPSFGRRDLCGRRPGGW